MAHILLTNDDGIQAPGLRALLEALRPLGRVSVFAPDHNWSAAGHTKTMHKPLRVARFALPGIEGDEVEAYTSTGAPSDCVALALLGLLPDRPDVVVSGINQGANLGHDVTYSGTVAAAMEAAIFGLPAVAVSLDSYESQEFGLAARVGAGVVAKVQEHGLPAGTLLNVNVPPLAPGELAGTAVTRMGRRVYRDVLVDRRDPRGRPYYWIGGEPPSGHLDEGTDIWAVAQGYVSITPIHLDMTAHDLIPNLEAWSLTELSTR
ncbi:MAG: 5'/3'-nucleotidase SurE [Anaerolineae bacterium]|nr:5'/3'-nucleotidase SurE [Anaerolineae bacterium]